jgi:putative RNA 2'-phosphotransferase
MMKQKYYSESKFLSYVLRHRPDVIGVTINPNGWVNTDLLIAKMREQGFDIDFEKLQIVVLDNDKQRFAFNG